VSAQAKWEYRQAVYPRYRQARRREKQRILDEFCRTTSAGWTPTTAQSSSTGPSATTAKPTRSSSRAAGPTRRTTCARQPSPEPQPHLRPDPRGVSDRGAGQPAAPSGSVPGHHLRQKRQSSPAASGYLVNDSTIPPLVTLLDGLTGRKPVEPGGRPSTGLRRRGGSGLIDRTGAAGAGSSGSPAGSRSCGRRASGHRRNRTRCTHSATA